MAPLESSLNQSSTKKESSKDNKTPKEAQPETAQNQPIDPSITKIFQSTISGPDELTDPSIDDILRGAT